MGKEAEVKTFDSLIVEIFDGRNDLEGLKGLKDYVVKNRKSYSVVHFSTLINCLRVNIADRQLEIDLDKKRKINEIIKNGIK